jgi:DNA-binding NtrC family response regulator
MTSMSSCVLVVDDQEDVLQTLLRFLKVGGYESFGLTRFDEAKQYIDRERPQVLVTDIRLGPYNGLQLAHHIRAVHPSAGVVVLSAWDDPLLRQEAESIGALYYMKPLDRQQLCAAVATALANS